MDGSVHKTGSNSSLTSKGILVAGLIVLLLTVPACRRSEKRPVAPTLPGASVETLGGVQEGIFEITYTVRDPQEDVVDVTVEFTTDGVSFAACTRAPGGQTVSDLTTTTTGLDYTFRWNSVADSVALTSPLDTVQIRVTPYQTDGTGLPEAGFSGTSDMFSVDNSTGNTAPTVQIVSSLEGILSGDVTVQYSISDVQADQGYVEVLYKTSDMADWEPATLSSASDGEIAGNLLLNMSLSSSPDNQWIVWDSIQDLGPTYAHEVQIRVVGHDARPGGPADTNVFRIDNTPAPVPPVVALTAPASPCRGLVTLDYDLSDNNAETVNLVFELSLDAGATWQVPTLKYCDAGLRVDNAVFGVPCLPWPQAHHVIWDSAADVGFSLNYTVRLRARPEASVQGDWDETPDFAVDNSSPAGAPTAVITADKVCVQSGEEIHFSAMDSVGSPTTFLWNFGDGSCSCATELTHTYSTGPDEFAVSLTVTNAAGVSDTALASVVVTEAVSDYRTELEPYRNPAETRTQLAQLAQQYPDIMTIYVVGYSVEGREIYVIKISDNVTEDEDEPTIHFDAAHHAREVMTPEVIIDTVEQLVTNYGSDPEIQGWVDSYEIYLMPCVNPDGATAIFTTDWGIRKNANGVDLNRNYPADWGNPAGSSGSPGSNTYRGPYPASEPEVQTLIAQTLSTRPVVGITYHSYSNIVLYPYSSPGLTQTSQDAYLEQVAQDMANNMTRDVGGNYLYDHRLWYDASGTTRDWMYRDIGTFCLLVEVGDAMGGGGSGFHPDYATYHAPQVQGVRGGWKELIRYAGKGAICGHVTDAATSEPLEADISVSGFLELNSEIRRSEPKFGSYYWLWADGDYTVTFTIEGYETQSHDITVAGAPCVLDVALVKKVGGNHRPTAAFTTSMTRFEVGTEIFLDASTSSDEDGDSLTCDWDFGDDERSTGPTSTHQFNRTGTHRVVLTVSDGKGGVHETWHLVHVMGPSVAPHVTCEPVTGSWQRDVLVSYEISSPTPSNCSIAVEYTCDGLVWYPATIAGADVGSVSANTVSSIVTTPEPSSHYFLWDSMADLGVVGATAVALKVTPFVPGGIYGDPAITNLFTVDNTAANSPPLVTLALPSSPLFYKITFGGIITDPDYESCSLTVEYSLDSGTNWSTATIASSAEGSVTGNMIMGIAASPTGTPYSFRWDSYRDLGAAQVTGIWVRVTPHDSEAEGTSALVTGIWLDNVGLKVTSPVSTDTIDSSQQITWYWASASGSREEDLVYEIDYAPGVGKVYFCDDFHLEPGPEWEFTGDSRWDQGSETVVLARITGGAGGLWCTRDVLTAEWYCRWRFQIEGSSSARGFYFSFYSQPTTSEYPADGYTIEFDACYDSSVDPYDTRHIALLSASGSHLCYAVNDDFADESWHTVEVYYKDGLLRVDMDGANVLGYWIETPDTSHLRFGFGGRDDPGVTYYVDDVMLAQGKPAWSPLATTTDGLVTTGGTGSYTWDAAGLSSGTNCVVRIRGCNGTRYSRYAFSQPFTIEHPGTPSASLIDPTGVKRYEVPLDFTLNDPTSDTCSVRLYYSPDSGTNWYGASIKSASNGMVDGSTISGLTSGTTELYTVVWNAWRDLGEVDNPAVQLRLTPSDTLAGADSETLDFEVDNTGHAGELTGFTATAQGGDVVLSWTNPAAPSLHGIRVVRRTDRFPTDPGDGLTVYDSADTGAYFDGTGLTDPPEFVRQDSMIDFAWGYGSPGSLGVNYFSVRWTATIDIVRPGPYNFHTLSEDGARLYVDGDLIVDRWVGQYATEYCGYKTLISGSHHLVMEYHHNLGNAEAHLYYTGPGIGRTVVPILPGHTLTYTDRNVNIGTTYYYTAFTYTGGNTFSTGALSARDSVTP